MFKLIDLKKYSVLKPMSNERGVALILTMSMLVILSILGVMVLETTNTELGITTNYRVASEAFTAAELAVEYTAQKAINDRDEIGDLSTETALMAALPEGMVLDGSGRNELISYTSSMHSEMMTTTSTDAYQGNIYRTGDDSDVEGNTIYYRVAIQAKARNRSTARIEKLFVNRGGHVF